MEKDLMQKDMGSGKTNKTKWVHLRMSPREYEMLSGRLNRTTCRSMSEFVRDIIFNRPVVTTFRNASMDDLLGQLTALNKELVAIGGNINQATKKIHMSGPEINAPLIDGYRNAVESVQQKILNIKQLLVELSEAWLR